MPNVIFCSYGDMLRVPGSQGDLFKAKSEGADVRMVYSPMDALALARENPDREVVMGVTSGASTPDKSVQDSLSSIFLLKKMSSGGQEA